MLVHSYYQISPEIFSGFKSGLWLSHSRTFTGGPEATPLLSWACGGRCFVGRPLTKSRSRVHWSWFSSWMCPSLHSSFPWPWLVSQFLLQKYHHMMFGKVIIGFLAIVLSLTKAHQSQLLRLIRIPALRRVMVVAKVFMDDRDHCSHWDLPWCRNSSVLVPRSVPRHNPVSEVYRQVLGLHGLVCTLTCTVNCGTLDRHVLFPIMSNQLNLKLSSCNSWQIIRGNRMHLRSVFSVNTYVLLCLYF